MISLQTRMIPYCGASRSTALHSRLGSICDVPWLLLIRCGVYCDRSLPSIERVLLIVNLNKSFEVVLA